MFYTNNFFNRNHLEKRSLKRFLLQIKTWKHRLSLKVLIIEMKTARSFQVKNITKRDLLHKILFKILDLFSWISKFH